MLLSRALPRSRRRCHPFFSAAAATCPTSSLSSSSSSAAAPSRPPLHTTSTRRKAFASSFASFPSSPPPSRCCSNPTSSSSTTRSVSSSSSSSPSTPPCGSSSSSSSSSSSGARSPSNGSSRLAAKGEVKSLKAFIRRAQVLALYRSFLRYAGRLDRPDLQLDITTQVQNGFHLHREGEVYNLSSLLSRETQEYNISSLLVEAGRHLEQLKSMVPRQGGWEGGKGVKEEDEEEEGKEYVVGEGWPWQK